MGLLRSIEYGAFGMIADRFLGSVTCGRGGLLGTLAGLFLPDADDMNRAVSSRPSLRVGLFESTQGNPWDDPQRATPTTSSWSSIVKAGALLFGATMLFGGGDFGTPLYGSWLAGLTPYNAAGYIPLAWSNGLIPRWGALASLGY